MKKMYFKVGNTVTGFNINTEKDVVKLTLSRGKYEEIHVVELIAFPQDFVLQETGEEYELYDCIEPSTGWVQAIYNKK